MPQPLKNDLQGRLGYWLYHHGWPRLGNWLWIRSRTWYEYIRRQYPDFCPECGLMDGDGHTCPQSSEVS